MRFDEGSECFIHDPTHTHYDELLQLRSFDCPVDGCAHKVGGGGGITGGVRASLCHSRAPPWSWQCGNLAALKKHLISHKRFHCALCLENRHWFIQEQHTYSAAELAQHLRSGDEGTPATLLARVTTPYPS